MELPIRRRRRTLEEINAVAQRYWQSGLTQRAFVAAEGVCVATLAKYLRVAAERKRPAKRLLTESGVAMETARDYAALSCKARKGQACAGECGVQAGESPVCRVGCMRQ